MTTMQHSCDRSILRDTLAYRAAIAFDMKEAAKQSGIDILTDGFVVASSSDGMIVNTGISDVDKLERDALRRGASILFIYLATPRGAKLGSGFYIVRVAAGKEDGDRCNGNEKTENSEAGAWRAQLMDRHGNFVTELEVQATERPVDRRKPTYSGSINDNKYVLDIDFGRIHIEIIVTVKPGESPGGETPAGGSP